MKSSVKNLMSLLEKAADATTEGITISSILEEDKPIIYLNEGFERLTGYTREEVIGKNCRFLQGEDTEPGAVEELRTAIREGSPCTVELLNYKKDGTPFWNRLAITPILNGTNEVTHYVGIQSDITELKETKSKLELANKDLASFHKRITNDLDQAKKAQEFILPTEIPVSKKVQFAKEFHPLEEIGGDYYDIIDKGQDVYGILIADVTGHGIPAALLTFMTSYALKNTANNISSTSEVARITNIKLIDKMPEGTFITMMYAVYDAKKRKLTYTRAGHPPGYIVRPGAKELISLSTDGSLIGALYDEEVSYEEKEIILEKGDKVILYSDAILEARRGKDIYLGKDLLSSLLLENSHYPINQLLKSVYNYGLEFSEKSSFDDDFTLLGFEVLE